MTQFKVLFSFLNFNILFDIKQMNNCFGNNVKKKFMKRYQDAKISGLKECLWNVSYFLNTCKILVYKHALCG